MGRKIISIPELYTDKIDSAGLTQDISFRFRAIFDDDPTGKGEWHYFGTKVPPEMTDAIQHAALHFPAMLALLGEEEQTLLYDVALMAGKAALEA